MRNLLKKLTSAVRNRSTAVIVAGLMLALPATAFAAWGPSRPVYDYNNNDQRQGSMTGPVFNSFINTPSYGDERNFVTTRNVGQAAWTEEVTADPGQEVEFRAYVHNNANQSTNGTNFDGVGVARNTKVRFYVPSETSQGFDIGGYVSADNATPRRVYDTATVKSKSGQGVSLSYVPGSARLYNNGSFQNGVAIPDGVVSATGDGTLIGWSALNGVFPGCFEYDAVVIIKVKVTAPKLELKKTVSKVEKPGPTDGRESVSAKRGETISWRVDYKNTGNAQIDDITIRDNIPAGLTLVPGSISVSDVRRPTGQALGDTALSGGGVNVGSYTANSNGVIRFRTKINQDVKDCEIKNVAFGKAKDVPEISDDAKIIIEDCKQEEKCPSNPDLPKGHPDCDKKCPSNSSLPFGHPDCDKPPVVPPVTTPPSGKLPSTGPGEMIGLFVATTIAGSLAHKFVLGRRFL